MKKQGGKNKKTAAMQRFFYRLIFKKMILIFF